MGKIHNAFRERSTLLLHGLPGVGKTAIAAEYILRYRDEYHMVGYLRYPFEDRSLGQMFESLTERSEGDPGVQPYRIPSIGPRLQFYNDGLIVIDLGNTLRLSAPLQRLTRDALKQTKARVLLLSNQSRLHRSPDLPKLARIKVSDLLTDSNRACAPGDRF